jgi:DNA-binding CsgD family transcriptional regulator
MAADVSLDLLTENERVVLDGLLTHKKSKQIARDLDISVSAAEERIRSARQKLNAPDRTTAVRIYASLISGHSESVPRFQGMVADPISPDELVRELTGGPNFPLRDVQPWAQWGEVNRQPRTLLETFDRKFGWPGRLLLIVACFVVLCLALGQMFDIAESLNRIV